MKYRSEIDGLRALAVIPVILFHADFKFFSGGYLGVDVFFVISGYLITALITEEMDSGRFSLLGFYGRRARRILPALFLIAAVCIPFAWAWLPVLEKRDFAQSLIATVTFSSNIQFWRESGYFDNAAELKPLLHTWSLAVEEQYYILFPLLLMVTWKSAKLVHLVLAVLFAASLVFAQWSAYSDPKTAFFLLPARGWEILLGAFCALYYKKNIMPGNMLASTLSVIGLVLILASMIGYDDTTPNSSLYTLVPTVGAALIILFARAGTPVAAVLGFKVFTGIGLISYSAYLWHYPLFAFYRVRFHDGEHTAVILSALALTSFVLAFFTWKYVETPFRRVGELRRRKQLAALAVGAASLLAAFGFVVHFAFSPYLQRITIGDSFLPVEAKFRGILVNGQDCSSPTAEKPPCKITGNGESNETLMLLGDSHARVLSKAFYETKDSFGALYDMSMSGCIFLHNMAVRGRFSVGGACNTAHQKWRLAFIESIPDPKTFIYQARIPFYYHYENFENGKGYTEYREHVFAASEDMKMSDGERKLYFLQSLRETLALLSAMGRVIVVYPTHVNGWDPVNMASFLAKSGYDYDAIERYLEIPISAVKPWVRDVEMVLDEVVAANRNVYKIDPKEITCGPKVCQSLRNRRFLFTDASHLSLDVNRAIADQILAVMEISARRPTGLENQE